MLRSRRREPCFKIIIARPAAFKLTTRTGSRVLGTGPRSVATGAYESSRGPLTSLIWVSGVTGVDGWVHRRRRQIGEQADGTLSQGRPPRIAPGHSIFGRRVSSVRPCRRSAIVDRKERGLGYVRCFRLHGRGNAADTTMEGEDEGNRPSAAACGTRASNQATVRPEHVEAARDLSHLADMAWSECWRYATNLGLRLLIRGGSR